MAVVDGTLGAGGHSLAILKKIFPGGRLISIDLDKRALRNFEKVLQKKGFSVDPASSGWHRISGVKRKLIGDRPSSAASVPSRKLGFVYWRGVNDNFANLDTIVAEMPGIESGVKAVFADLGMSSDQLGDGTRGFSFQKGGPLDMRYSPEKQEKTAADIVNGYTKKELARIFRDFGEEKYAERIARATAREREAKKIDSTSELTKIVSKAVPQRYKKRRIHFATRVFQALRIEVNEELENLRKLLKNSGSLLSENGRLAIITFHSLEDRIVKNFFRDESRDCVCPPHCPKCECSHERSLKIITKKPIVAEEEEIKKNPRARSAKLRVAERI